MTLGELQRKNAGFLKSVMKKLVRKSSSSTAWDPPPDVPHSFPAQYTGSAYSSKPVSPQPGSPLGLTVPPVAYSKGRDEPSSSSWSKHNASREADVYEIRALPPWSSQDDVTGPSPKNLVTAVKAVKGAVNDFAKALISDMNKYPEELKHLKQRIRDEVQGDVDRANHWTFLVQAFVCQRMFEGFESENGFFGLEQFDDLKKSKTSSFNDFLRYKDKGATISELFARDAEDTSFLGRYCFKKFKSICVDPVTKQSLAIYEQKWRWVEEERHVQSEFYESFVKVAVSVWVLHLLVHSFEQGWKMLGWETFPKGRKFQKRTMKSVYFGGYEEEDVEIRTDVTKIVGFLVIPGFVVSRSVVKCEVYVRKKNNLTDSKIMDSCLGGSCDNCDNCRARSHLKNAKKSAEAVEMMSGSIKFNNEQCKYLGDRLRVVIQSASSFLMVSERKDIGTTSKQDETDFVRIFELPMILGKEIESFVKGCCKDKWVQAAMVLSNVSEYVSSLGFNLHLCKVALGKDDAGSGWHTPDEVDGMKKSEAEVVKQKASVDAKLLIDKVVLALNRLHGEDRDLASYLLQRLMEINHSPSSETGTILSNVFDMVESGEQVGRGGSATVYKAMWLGTWVAKKTFRGSENVNFEKEVEILSRLRHPNITSLFCSTKNNRNCSIIMELMDGDLNHLMDKRCEDSGDSRPFPILVAVDIMLQIGEGVNYLHNQGIVHRDLKSGNILYKNVQVNNDAIGYVHVKVGDFGVSRARDTNTTYSDLTCNTGTSRWMPPEVIGMLDGNEGGMRSSAASLPRYPFKLDSYSFGLVCYEILVGREPFGECSNPNEAKRRILKKDRPILPCDPSECPVMLKALIEKCWSHEPEERPAFDVICRELTFVKYSLMRGGSMMHGVVDCRMGEKIGVRKSAGSESGHLDSRRHSEPVSQCMPSSVALVALEGRDKVAEVSSQSLELSRCVSSSADYLTLPQKSSMDESPSSGDSLSSPPNSEVVTCGSMMHGVVDCRMGEKIGDGKSAMSESGHLDSTQHSEPVSHCMPSSVALVALEGRDKVAEVSSQSLELSGCTAADYLTLPRKSSMEESPSSGDSLTSSPNSEGVTRGSMMHGVVDCRMGEKIGVRKSAGSESGHLDSRRHSEPVSQCMPSSVALVASEGRGKIKEVSSQSLQLSGCVSTSADYLTLPQKSSMDKFPHSCDSLTSSPNSEGRFNLHHLKLSAEAGHVTCLTSLDLERLGGVEQLSVVLGELRGLMTLDLEGCKDLQHLSVEIGQLTSLTRLVLKECVRLKLLPIEIGQLINLITLDLSGCGGLQQLPAEIGQLRSLTTLKLGGCGGLQNLPVEIGQLINLITLDLKGCGGLQQLPAQIGQLTTLTTLKLGGCEGLHRLPNEIGQLINLITLNLWGCGGLQQLPAQIGQLTSLTNLELGACEGLQRLPNEIGQLISLTTLTLWRCEGLRQLPDEIGQLTNLITLDMWGCRRLQQLPAQISHLPSLTTFKLGGCKALQDLSDEIGQMSGLFVLDMSGCEGF